MNERLMRAAPRCFAQFVTAFDDGEARPQPTRGPAAGQVLLLFRSRALVVSTLCSQMLPSAW